MSQSASFSFGKWLAGIAATVIGALIIWILTHPGGLLNPLPPTPTPVETTPTSARPADIPLAASPTARLGSITISLTNNNCVDEDYYVDDKLVTTVAAGASTTFQITPGQHSSYVCLPGTMTCAEPSQVNWSTSTPWQIFRGPACPLTIYLTNNNCADEDYYVDGKFVTSIAAGASTTFQIAPGQHSNYACLPGTTTCGESSQVNWSTSATTASIFRNPSCLITITLTNNHCEPQEFYVDGQLVASPAPGATTTFQIAPGAHSARACAAGTTSCTEAQVDWPTSTTYILFRGSNCP